MRSCHLAQHRSKEAGFSLVEVLVALAITVMIGVSITSVLMSIAANNHRDLKRTNYHESLRLAATIIMEDGRHATDVNDGWGAYLEFRYGSPNDYNRYTFASWDGSADGIPDPKNLHRWEVRGGNLQRDEIVAWDLVPPGHPQYEPTFFEAVSSTYNRWGRAYLVKPPLSSGQTNTTRLDVFALLR